MSGELEFTGERFVPGTRGEIWVEHWHRYHFAARWVAGKRVLDVACGEGYGSAVLARHAASVVGVDLSEDAIAHAKDAYAGLANTEFIAASCTQMPLADASFDVAVTFETIEHIAEQEAFVSELARVLKPGGVLVLSSPNKLEYSDRREFVNEFHVKELYREELEKLVAAKFPQMAWYGQRPSFFSVIAPEKPAQPSGELLEVEEKSAAEAQASFAHPLYFLLAASRDAASLATLAPAVSVLADREDWVHRDYEQVMRDQVAAVERIDHAVKVIGERDQLISTLQQDLGQAREEKIAAEWHLNHLREEIAAEREQVAQNIAGLNTEIRARDSRLDAKQHEIDRRRGWRWWLKLPWIRLGILKDNA